MDPLQVLGVSATAEHLYLDLVERGELPLSDLAVPPDTDPVRVTAALSELERIGLVEVDGERVTPRPPQLILESLAQQRAREAMAARESASVLSRLWSTGVGQQSYLEPLPSNEAARAVLDHVQADAREQVHAMTIGNLSSPQHKIVDGLFEALTRGVTYQVIYGTQVLQDPPSMRKVRACVEAGEQARVFPQVPVNLTLVDDRWALVAARAPIAGKHSVAAFVVHRSPFLTGLRGIFDAFWRMAVPITGQAEADDTLGAPSGETKQLLTYLSAGLTDESIAREFGVSERTIARRISRLQEILGAQTRFQLGVQASRQGWL